MCQVSDSFGHNLYPEVLINILDISHTQVSSNWPLTGKEMGQSGSDFKEYK